MTKPDSRPVGRPRIIESPEEFTKRADAYFADCKVEGKRPTVTGLAYNVGLASRQSLCDYENKPEFIYTVKRAKLFVEMGYEEALSQSNAAGPIFALKNFEWTDKQQLEHTHKLEGMSDEELKRRLESLRGDK